MKLLLVIFWITFALEINAKSFNEVLHLHKFQIKPYLNAHNIDELNSITPIYLNKNLKNGFWPNHWPFAAGVSNKKAFWISYKRLGFVEIHPIENKNFIQLSDINGTQNGELLISDKDANTLYIFKLNNGLTEASMVKTLTIKKPEKIAINSNNTSAILGENTLSFIKKTNNTFNVDKKLSEKINKKLTSKNILDLYYDSKNHLHILIENKILTFNSNGDMLKKIELKKSINEFAITPHNNIIGTNYKKNMLYTFSKNGLILKKKAFPKFKDPHPLQFCYYPAFSYVGIYSKHEGYAYNMGLEITQFSWISSRASTRTFSFISTFPSTFTITIKNEKNQTIKTIMKEKILTADKHTFSFNMPPKRTSAEYKLIISGTALYSSSNTISKTIIF